MGKHGLQFYRVNAFLLALYFQWRDCQYGNIPGRRNSMWRSSEMSKNVRRLDPILKIILKLLKVEVPKSNL